jgi:hypothetical protein
VIEEATLEQECMATEETHQYDLIVMPRRSARKLSATLLLLALKLLDRGKRTTQEHKLLMPACVPPLSTWLVSSLAQLVYPMMTKKPSHYVPIRTLCYFTKQRQLSIIMLWLLLP